MNAKTFVDTNVLVYAYDERDGYKQETAKQDFAQPQTRTIWGREYAGLAGVLQYSHSEIGFSCTEG